MARDIGIDLGTTNVLIHLQGRGIILNEPAVIAVDRSSQEVIAVGREAYEMRGRVPETLEVIQPLKGGVVSDYDLTEAMLLHFFRRAHIRRGIRKANVLISTPTNVSEIEQLSLYEAVQKVTSGRVRIEAEPMVAAVGSGLDVLSAKGCMIVDIGGGTTDIAIIASGEILHAESIKIAGDDFDEAIIQYFKDQYQLLIGIQSAERIKIQLACAQMVEGRDVHNQELKGRDLVTGLPKAINVDSNDLYRALKDLLEQIVRAIRRVIEQASPEIIADIHDRGLVITGGGAMIQDLDLLITEQIKVSAIPSDQPMNAVALGTGMMMDWIDSGLVDPNKNNKKTRQNNLFIKIWRSIWK
ncbi:rod shape-determining protein [Facklamia miroungae]|uniref:Cell shape-determining protein MreB n=1 Tax=Facklamia miroungae TaxID=120956 RepID=A0A1G7TT78_9LACT|nr:rod shape-determining protein [Facklamia miroungae]NKZ29959.1 rod shape-determining protein [Facklamia miroungae]SDG38411.1 rod shape-determining protein MreB [Facklamia miroungae]